MQGNAGGGGEPPPQGGPVGIICQRTPVGPVSGLCAVCLHQRGGVLEGGTQVCCWRVHEPCTTRQYLVYSAPGRSSTTAAAAAVTGGGQLAAISRQNAEQTRELKQMVLTMATQQYTAAQELEKASSKPMDSAKFSTEAGLAEEIWIHVTV